MACCITDMPAIDFGTSSYERARGGMPALPVLNMVFEPAPTEPGGFALQSRLPLADRSADMGAGPVAQLFRGDLVLGGALFGVSAGTLYEGTTARGAIAGSGPVSMAGYPGVLFVNAGGSVYTWDGTSLAAVSFPDSADVTKVVMAASRVVALKKDSGAFYWTGALGSTFEALDFATAESMPDGSLDALYIDGILVIFGAETTEYWHSGGDADLPFVPVVARVIEKGIRATGCAAPINNTFAWVTNENHVCLYDENTIISNAGLQERIAASTACRLFRFVMNGDQYLALRLDSETQVFSPRETKWSEFGSQDETNWLPQCYAGGVFGSAKDGKTLAFGTSGALELGAELERRFRAGFPIDGGGVQVSNVHLRCNVGQTPYLTGDYTNPSIQMRISRNAGKTWGAWKTRRLGAQGEYRKRVRWNGVGQASRPGFLAEFRVTDPVDVRVSGVLVNELHGGR